MQATYIWENLEHKGMEYLKISSSSDRRVVTSTVIHTLETTKIEYEITLTKNWEFVQLILKNDQLDKELILNRNRNGTWREDNTAELDYLEGACDIDLSCTPFTNTLPINRCGWKKNEPIHFEMAYIDANDLSIRKVKQTYTLITQYRTERVFHYSSGSFQADILVNKEGIVTDYPDYFGLLSPST
ncbi:putative glycolipid-binding domain-containing protein [Alkalicoccobacillus porphyridii]|uniref:Glycolipid-binding domain-containing protein n=1 Tax=Alkalicoccobacillus porphyridii TaxID=2597270 RepID=A0A554A242_9BACI|nr:putative glycolipid-binding domain-containing protein [Alkalicoccobacillus porphyridii]TSB47762.1 hypothetical protein FN960_04395 [Alkalicoccobacillus porphyridii]